MTETPNVVTVTTAGTPVQALPNGPLVCKLEFANPVGITGNLYLGKIGMVKATLVGVISVIVPGQSRWIEDQNGDNTIDSRQYWVDHDTSASKVLVPFAQR